MKGLTFIALLIALLIVLYLTLSRTKTKTNSALDENTPIEMPEELTDLPSHVEKKVLDAAEKAEERTKRALDGVE